MGSRMSGGMHVGIAEEGQREIVSQEERHRGVDRQRTDTLDKNVYQQHMLVVFFVS